MSLRDLLPTSERRPNETSGGVGPDRLPSRFLHTLSVHERELWFFALAAMLVDVTLTVHGLQLGLEELNPIARAALDAVGVVGLYFLKGVAIGLGLCCRYLVPREFVGLIPLGLAIPSGVAVVINATLVTYVAV